MKVRHSILAVLALLCSATMFTACGSDDDDNSPKVDNTRAKVALKFYFQTTEDVLNYCDVKVTIDNGKGGTDSAFMTEDNVEKVGDKYYFNATIGGALPATFKISRKVTMKENVDLSSVTSIEFSSGYKYIYAFYNAAGDVLNLNDGSLKDVTWPTTHKSAPELFAKNVNDGALDITYTFTFDKDGNMDMDF